MVKVLPEVDAVIDAVVDSFNSHAKIINYGPVASIGIPVKVQDITELPRVGGQCSQPVEDCRCIALYVVAAHVTVQDHYAKSERQMSYSDVGALFNRPDRSQVSRMIKRACRLLSEPAFSMVYDHSINSLEKAGRKMFNTKKRFCA
jgi:hypothetical protein